MELGYWREIYFSLFGVYIRCQEQPILICFVGFFGVKRIGIDGTGRHLASADLVLECVAIFFVGQRDLLH